MGEAESDPFFEGDSFLEVDLSFEVGLFAPVLPPFGLEALGEGVEELLRFILAERQWVDDLGSEGIINVYRSIEVEDWICLFIPWGLGRSRAGA